jgi:poly(A) polymerase
MRFVGGCVRNTLLGLEAGDLDIATSHSPATVIALAERAGLKAVPTGIEHGTITVVAHGKPFEVTTLRRDVQTDGRQAPVQFTDDWAADAARRDFTMNAIYADAAGALFDPVGGIEDARAGRVRFIGDAAARIREDFLRILRFFRFDAWYGEGELDGAGLAACAAEKAGLKQLSAERVQKELLRLLEAREPVEALRAMSEAGVLGLVLPEAQEFDALAGLVIVEADYLRAADAVRRLSVLIEADAAGAAALASRLRLSNTDRERLIRLRTSRPQIAAEIEGRSLHARLYREGVAAIEDEIVLAWAARGPNRDVDLWICLLDLVRGYKRPQFPLTGYDVMALGLSGARVGEVLSALEEWWIAEDFTPDHAAVLAKAKSMAQG